MLKIRQEKHEKAQRINDLVATRLAPVCRHGTPRKKISTVRLLSLFFR
jgi:hypothetical protein